MYTPDVARYPGLQDNIEITDRSHSLFDLKTVLLQARRALCRHTLRRLVNNGTAQTSRPLRIAALRSNLDAIINHGEQFLLVIVKLRRWDIALIREFGVGQEHDGGFVLLVAAEKSRALVQAFGHEGGYVGDRGHARQTGSLGFDVCVDDFCAVGPAVVRVGRVVVDDYNVNGARWLEKWPDGIVLVGLSSIDELKLV